MEAWKETKFFFAEDDFREKMQTVVVPWIKEEVCNEQIYAKDHTNLNYYYAIPQNPRAVVVLLHGFCEFFGKYHEMMYYFYQAGYAVFFMEQRGHGFSGRKVKELDKVYVKNYQEYVDDLAVLMKEAVQTKCPDLKYFLLAHSMGGAVGALYLEQHPHSFQAAVLSSPMFAMNFRGIPLWKVKALLLWSVIGHLDEKYVPGQHGFDRKPDFEHSSTLSMARYDYLFEQRLNCPEYTMYGGTYAWTRAAVFATRKLLKNAGKIQIPLLLCQAKKDTMVDPAGQKQFAKRVKQIRFLIFEESKHEIFNAKTEERIRYYQDIFSFLEEEGQRKTPEFP